MGTASIYLLLILAAGVASWYLAPLKWMALLSALSHLITGLRGRRTTVDGVRWHYLEGGAGEDGSRRTLVILHGLAAEADHWMGVASPLRRDFHVLVPDLPGFGASQPPAGLDFSIRAQSLRLEGWLDQLGVNECLLAGNSMGAWIAADFAARHPGRVPALWLQSPFGVLSAQPSEVLSGLELDGVNPFSVDTMADYRNLVAIMFRRPPHLPYPIARAGFLNAHRLREDLPRMQAEVLEQSEPLESLAPRLTMPVLVEWGREDRAVHVSGAEVLKKLLPDCRVVIHDDIGHLPLLECPTLAAGTFRQFALDHGMLAP
jgi:pimeloyl-ACP methyl ester carboxylesterase